MKQAAIIFLLLTAVISRCPAQECRAVNVDLVTAIIYGRIEFGAEYAFCEKWSAGAEVSVNIKRIADGPGNEEREHWTELYGTAYSGVTSGGRNMAEYGILLHYWPRNAFDGPVLEVGARVRDRDGPDMIAGIGYRCRIWKGMKATFAYKVGIIGCIKGRIGPLEGLRIGISYAF